MESDPELEELKQRKIAELYETEKLSQQGIIDLTDKNFEKTIKESPLPVFVDFWAVWCRPCKVVAPIIKDFAEDEYRGKILFVKLNTDENPIISTKLRIMSIPTFIMFWKGKPVTRFVGALPREKIKSIIDKALEKIS